MLLGSQREGVLLEKEVPGREDLCPIRAGTSRPRCPVRALLGSLAGRIWTLGGKEFDGVKANVLRITCERSEVRLIRLLGTQDGA